MEFLKGILIAGALAIGLEAAVVQAENLITDDVPLFVNTNRTHYVMEKSREQGERDLWGLAKRDDVEDAWIFVKSNGKSYWHEHGVREFMYGASIDRSALKDMLENDSIDELSLYHHHPFFSMTYARNLTPGASNDIPDIEKNALSETFSQNDILISLKLLKIINDVNPTLADCLDMRLVVSTGVYTIEVDKKVFFNEAAEDMLRDLSQEVYFKRKEIGWGMSEEFDYSIRNKANFAELNRKFARKFSNKYVKIRFEVMR